MHIKKIFFVISLSIFGVIGHTNENDINAEITKKLQGDFNKYLNSLDNIPSNNAYSSLLGINSSINNDFILVGENFLEQTLNSTKSHFLEKSNSLDKYDNCESELFDREYWGRSIVECINNGFDKGNYVYVQLNDDAKKLISLSNPNSILKNNSENIKEWERKVQNKELIEPIISINTLLLDRYQKIIQNDNFYSYPIIQTFGYDYIGKNDLLILVDLFLIKTLYQIQNGEKEKALIDLKNSINFFGNWGNYDYSDYLLSIQFYPTILNKHLSLLQFLIVNNYIESNEIELFKDDIDTINMKERLENYAKLLTEFSVIELLSGHYNFVDNNQLDEEIIEYYKILQCRQKFYSSNLYNQLIDNKKNTDYIDQYIIDDLNSSYKSECLQSIHLISKKSFLKLNSIKSLEYLSSQHFNNLLKLIKNANYLLNNNKDNI